MIGSINEKFHRGKAPQLPALCLGQLIKAPLALQGRGFCWANQPTGPFSFDGRSFCEIVLQTGQVQDPNSLGSDWVHPGHGG